MLLTSLGSGEGKGAASASRAFDSLCGENLVGVFNAKARKRGLNGESIAAGQNILNTTFAGITSAQAPGVQTPLLDLPSNAPPAAQDIARGRKGLVLSGLTEGVIAKLRADNSALADFIQLDPNKPGQGKLAIQGPLTVEALAIIREILLESGVTVE